MTSERHSIATIPSLVEDPAARADQEAANGIRQFQRTIDIIRGFVADEERPYRLRTSQILELNQIALQGVHIFAGTYRNGPVDIKGARHQPPDAFQVAELVEDMCDYVNGNWNNSSAIHLGAYLLWRLNWIHPFADGNGRTSRAVAYMVLSIKLDSVLPGVPTIPDQIADNKTPYYDALEAADLAWEDSQTVDVSQMEAMLNSMLAQQLISAANSAMGKT